MARFTGLLLFTSALTVSLLSAQNFASTDSEPETGDARALRQSSQDTLWLTPGTPVEGEFAAGEQATFWLQLPARSFVRIRGLSRQDVPDPWLALQLFAAGGEKPLAIGAPAGFTFTVLTHQAGEPGRYRLEIGTDPPGRPARYHVWIDELLDSNQYQQRQDSLRNDPRVAWVRDHAVALRSIAPEDDDFSDLTGLSEYLGDARMVMLGEWGHSMGNNYSAKTRLVKFLHQQLGFDVLAVEMGLYDIGKLWRELNAGMALERALPRERVGFWITADFMPLWEYVAHWATTAHPLEVVGFDRHTTSSLATDFFVSDLRSFLADADIDADAASRDSSFWAALQQVAVAHARPFTQVPSRNEHDVFLDAVDALRAEIRAAPSGLTQAGRFWMRALKTGSRHYHVEWDFATAGPHGFKSGRSATMAENLLWLAEEYYPGRKIIVWCENNHGLRNGAHLLPSSVDYATAGEGPLSIAKLAEFRPDLSRLRDWTSVAQYVQAIMGRDFYSIGTTAYEGLAWLSAGWWFQPDQDVSIELEELFVAAGFEQAFLDVRSLSNEADWLREPIVSNVFNRYNYGAGFRGILPFVFDGVLFLRTAQPSTHTDEIQVAPEVLRGYVGHYEVTPELTIAITLDSERLFAQAATGQYKIRLYAESETGFFVQGTHGVDARLTFQRDEAGAVTGLVLTQGGRDRPGRKVPSARSPGS